MCGGSVSKPVETKPKPKFKVGDRFRVREGVASGWDGHEGTITEVRETDYGRRYVFEPAMGRHTAFSEGSMVGQHAELIEQVINSSPPEVVDPKKPAFTGVDWDSEEAVIERITPPPIPVPQKIARVSVGNKRYHLTVKPAPFGALVRLGSSHGGTEMIDVSLDSIRQYARGLLEMADQQEGVAKNRPMPAVASVTLGSTMTYDGSSLVIHKGTPAEQIYSIGSGRPETVRFFEEALTIARAGVRAR